jgi:ribosome-associated toxin RatA of RatAB toxin-antitoxin module
VADQASSSITIDAAPEAVLAVIRDLDSYPAWAKGISKAVVDETGPLGPKKATFTANQSGFSDQYTLAYDWKADGVSWSLDGPTAIQKAQRGSYQLSVEGSGTKVLYLLSVDMKVPMIGMMKRRIEKMIIETALSGLKKRVESLK